MIAYSYDSFNGMRFNGCLQRLSTFQNLLSVSLLCIAGNQTVILAHSCRRIRVSSLAFLIAYVAAANNHCAAVAVSSLAFLIAYICDLRALVALSMSWVRIPSSFSCQRLQNKDVSSITAWHSVPDKVKADHLT